MALTEVNSLGIKDLEVKTADIAAANVTLAKVADVTDGQIIVGNGSNRPTAVAVSGDVTLANTGAVTIASGAVEHAMLANDCVDADNIDDNAVGLAAMAHGTDGNLITYDANGAPDHVATGSSGQVLTSNGSGAAPTFQAAAAGGVTNDAQKNIKGGTGAGANFNGTNAEHNVLLGYDAGNDITDGDKNICLGTDSGSDFDTGSHNICLGFDTGKTINGSSSRNVLIGNNTIGSGTAAASYDQVGIGYLTLGDNPAGKENVAIGTYALNSATGVEESVAIGYGALKDATTPDQNIAIGHNALANLVTGDANVVIGKDAGLNANTIGKAILIGYEAGKALVDGTNIAIGDRALSLGTSVNCRSNIAIGYRAMTDINGYSNIGIGGDCCGGGATGTGDSAYYNVALGDNALEDLTTGDNNTCIGVGAGDDINSGYDNVCVGHTSGNYIQSGFDNVYIGRDTTAAAEGDDGAVVVGANIGSKGEYKAFIGGSSGAYNGQNYSTWATTSDRRIKKNITNNTTGLDKINQITVRNFEYKKFKKDSDGIYLKDSFKKDSDGNYEKDSDGKYIPENPNGKYIPETTDDEITWSEFNGGNTQSDSIIVKKIGTQIGVIAQELESVLPGLVETDPKHGLKSVNTDNLVWYLVNAVKELSAKVTALESA